MNLIDLFSGCGGFALGANQAGFSVPLAFDVDPVLTSSYQRNFPDAEVHLSDVGRLSGVEISSLCEKSVDGVFGGPPCQGFSSIGLRRSDDPRRRLLFHFFRLVLELRPRFFIMENVTGLAFPDTRGVLQEAMDLVSGHYSMLGPIVLDAADFGAPTRRRRLFVIGTSPDCCGPLTLDDIDTFKRPHVNVRSAILDLLEAGYEGEEEGFDVWKLDGRRRRSDYANAMLARNKKFTGNQLTEHSASVSRRFSGIAPGKSDPIGKHFRLAWDGLCPALRAGTGSDKGSYQSVRPIHPEESRVISVREAARLQGFPDWFRFHPAIWHSFRMIGNSVSPIQSFALFSAVRRKLEEAGNIL